LASAIIVLLEKYDDDIAINVGTGKDISISELATTIQEVVGFDGDIAWDKSKPDGTPRKLLDIQRILDLGWSPKISLKEGISLTSEAFQREHYK
jgi:GDP-L-fucose synthase